MGINRNPVAFELRSEVIPVALVDSSIDFLASPTPAYRIVDIFSAGPQVAPAADTVLADTGPLPVGAFTMDFNIMAGETADHDIEWRNAPNTGNLINIRVRTVLGAVTFLWKVRFQIENENERIRVTNVAAGNVGIEYTSTILARI